MKPALGEGDGDTLAEGDADPDGDADPLGLMLAEAEGLRDWLADGDAERDALIDADALGETDAEGDTWKLAKLPSISALGFRTRLVLASGTMIDQMLGIYHVPPGAPVWSGVDGTTTGAPGPGSAP